MLDNTQPRDFLGLAAESFLTAKESEGCTQRTLDAYQPAIERFVHWLRDQGLTAPEDLTASVVRQYFAYLSHLGYSSAYVHHLARPVKTWLRFLYADGLIPNDAMARVKMPRLDKKILPAFTRDQVSTLLGQTKLLRDRALVLFLLDTGVRASEFCALSIGDVDLHTGAVTVRQGKGRKDRITYCGAAARRMLIRYLMTRPDTADDDPLFPSVTTGQRLNRNGLQLLLRRLGERAKVPHCHPHTFRRTCAIWSLRAGMDLRRLAALMGHEDLSVLKQYLDLVEVDLEDAHRQHGPVDELMKTSGRRRLR